MTDFTKILDKAKELEAKMKESQENIKKIRVEGIRFLSRVEIELEDSGDINLPEQNKTQTLDHQRPESALASPHQEKSMPQEQSQGNRRLRRAEAKMARKNARKK